MSEYKAPTVRPAPPEEPDWIDLSLPREVYRPLALLAAFWQVSRENAVGLLVRAVQFQEWPLGDIMTDPAAYQEWALRVTKAATGLKLPTVKDPSMQFDSNSWWEGVDRERRERERAERLMNDKLDAAAARQAAALEAGAPTDPYGRPRTAAEQAAAEECFCVRCHHLREGQSLMRDDGLCEECAAGAAAGEPIWLRQVQPLEDEADESE